MFAKFLCFASMIKDTYQAMALIVWLIFIKICEVNNKCQSVVLREQGQYFCFYNVSTKSK